MFGGKNIGAGMLDFYIACFMAMALLVLVLVILVRSCWFIFRQKEGRAERALDLVRLSARRILFVVVLIPLFFIVRIPCRSLYGMNDMFDSGYDIWHPLYILFLFGLALYLVIGIARKRIKKRAVYGITGIFLAALAVQIVERMWERNAIGCDSVLSGNKEYRAEFCEIDGDEDEAQMIGRVYATRNNALLFKATFHTEEMDSLFHRNFPEHVPEKSLSMLFYDSDRKIEFACASLDCSFRLPPTWAARLNTWLF